MHYYYVVPQVQPACLPLAHLLGFIGWCSKPDYGGNSNTYKSKLWVHLTLLLTARSIMLLCVVAAFSVLQWTEAYSKPLPTSVFYVSSSFSGYLRNASRSASISVTQVVQHALDLGSSPDPKNVTFVSAEERAYHALLAATGKEDTTANNESFTEALNEVKQAVYAACFIDGVTERDLPQLGQDLKSAYNNNKVHDLRKAYGSILCLKSKASRKRRQSIDDVYDDIPAKYVTSLFFLGRFSVGFAIDDTGSMHDEIEAVKCLVRAFIKSLRTEATQYILGTFNDPGKFSGV